MPRIERRRDRLEAQVRSPADIVASEDVARLVDRVTQEVDLAAGESWHEPGGAVDRAAFTLCRLRRARAGVRGGILHGDEAVREALGQADPDALVWLVARSIAYMDETGFPEAVEPWFE